MKETLELIIKKIKDVEEMNDQSVKFVLHGDRSGSLEDFWNDSRIIYFDTLEEILDA